MQDINERGLYWHKGIPRTIYQCGEIKHEGLGGVLKGGCGWYWYKSSTGWQMAKDLESKGEGFTPLRGIDYQERPVWFWGSPEYGVTGLAYWLEMVIVILAIPFAYLFKIFIGYPYLFLTYRRITRKWKD